MPKPPEARLIAALEHVRQLHEQRRAVPVLQVALDAVATFQSRRLGATYADLAQQRRYAQAIEFFQSDLYGPGDFSRRDADLARIVPTMGRLLPAGVIGVVARAMELSALSHVLDRALLDRLDADARPTVAQYAHAYRACGNRAERERQVAWIGEVGHGLDRYVRTPLLTNALKLMRLPARAAGLGALQRFLERGVSGFARMHGAEEFLATIAARENTLMAAIFAGDDAPFPDPLEGVRPS
ncbi:MAG: hypothetical protein ABI537_02345 [Casimicrobiaceae bacterium]